MALGVATTMFLSSKKGKEVTADAKDMMADFYKHISPKIKKMKKWGRRNIRCL